MSRQSVVGGAVRGRRHDDRLRLRGECRDLDRRAGRRCRQDAEKYLRRPGRRFCRRRLMALGIGLLPAGPRDASWRGCRCWSSAPSTGALLALDNALELDLTSVLYPVWQAGVAVGLAMALQRPILG